MHRTRLALFVSAALWVLGCSSTRDAAPKPGSKGDASEAAAKPAPDPDPKTDQRLVVYSGRGGVLVERLFEQFTADTGIQVDVRYGQTEPLANQLSTEKDDSPCDIFFAQESGYLGFLGRAGLLADLPKSVLDQVPADLRDEAGRWVGTSGRLRVLVYDPKTIKPDELPRTLAELADAKWKGKVGWAPDNASFQAHITALRHLWGEEKTKAWLQAMITAVEPRKYPKNSPQVQAAANGEIQIGWVNHYYLHKLKAADPTLGAANYSFPTAGDAGNLMMLAGVGTTKVSKRQELAAKLVSYLLSDKAQTYFAQEVFEYPVRPGVKTHPDVPPISDKVVRVDQQHLIDLAPTLALMRELKLQ